ncbi:hypothetical protein V6C27_03435 [Peptococcaceae bacterium 1198_IL3148]
MPKRIRGLLKNAGTTGPATLTTGSGYREPWKTGRAAYLKRLQRISGPNWPNT